MNKHIYKDFEVNRLCYRASHFSGPLVVNGKDITGDDGNLKGADSPVTVVATADGLTTGLIPAGARFVTVTSSNADFIATLPASQIGEIKRGWVGANGFELRTLASSNATINNQDSDGTKEAAIPANTLWQAECVATDKWILSAKTNLGAVITAIVPD